MLEALKRRRGELNDWLTARGLAHTFSLPAHQLHRATLPLVGRAARSPCLDAGSGRSPWKPLLAAQGVDVLSLDVEDRTGEVDLLADLQAMPEVADESMQTVLCTQVLEHLARPWCAISEIARVLAPGGHLILSVPHLSVLHEVPHDYFRYTRYGIQSLLDEAGFEVLEIQECGGLVSLLAHGASLVVMTTLGSLPGLRGPIWGLNYALLVRVAGWLDALMGLRSLYPCNYLALARKPTAGGRP
ncbi:class I SAM-dependent methyltransferase [Myxococcota bacterium]|nr:class I SAM-dependent methyltransferase [Myxococcota bacterium]